MDVPPRRGRPGGSTRQQIGVVRGEVETDLPADTPTLPRRGPAKSPSPFVSGTLRTRARRRTGRNPFRTRGSSCPLSSVVRGVEHWGAIVPCALRTRAPRRTLRSPFRTSLSSCRCSLSGPPTPLGRLRCPGKCPPEGHGRRVGSVIVERPCLTVGGPMGGCAGSAGASVGG